MNRNHEQTQTQARTASARADHAGVVVVVNAGLQKEVR